jgi:leucine dehydrogenase
MAEILKTNEQSVAENKVIQHMAEYDHEQVVFCNDNATGLKAIIAIHNTTLGPALGGTRMWMYNNESEALNDVLRLSRGMTYKAAISGLNLGGGKAVIIGDSKKQKSEALMRRFGKFVDSLGGKYITAEDVGIGTKDMEYVKMETDHVTGLPETMGGGGDPSPVTAYGVYMGMKASAKKVYGSDSLSGKKIWVQGIGHVGENLVRFLTEEGASVIIDDINESRVKEIASTYKCKVNDAADVYSADIDIYAPCALGATVNADTLSRLRCAIIAGAANNQLKNESSDGKLVTEKGIVWAPDFLINAGGLINVYSELYGYNRESAMSQASKIYDLTTAILDSAIAQGIPTIEAAKQIAEKRINEIGKIKLSY